MQEQAKPSSSVTQDISAGDDNDKEAEESVAEGSPQVAPQQHAAETGERNVYLHVQFVLRVVGQHCDMCS